VGTLTGTGREGGGNAQKTGLNMGKKLFIVLFKRKLNYSFTPPSPRPDKASLMTIRSYFCD